MNEASNFCNGPCYEDQRAQAQIKHKLPYVPTARDLEVKSIALDATHANGAQQFDAHSLIGTQEVKATHDWFLENQMRPMIIERSSFAGMGKFASRWLGDNFSDEAYMGFSVVGIMAHNLIGVPLAGSDICGFIGPTNAELCARWHMVGAFYPFSRNHNDRDSPSQEPWLFKSPYTASVSYFDVMKAAIKTKYRMIRYYYTELSMLAAEGGAFYKPLFFEFPADAKAYDNLQHNVMLGAALKLAILSDQLGAETADFYFPAGTWCDVVKGGLGTATCVAYAEGQTVTLAARAYDFHLHLRAGYIVPMQDTSSLDFKTSADLQAKPVDLHMHASCTDTCTAQGRYLNDDGVTVDLDGKQNIITMALTGAPSADIQIAFEQTASASSMEDSKVNENDVIGDIFLYNAKALGLDAKHTVTATIGEEQKVVGEADYDETNDKLVLKAAGVLMPSVSTLVFSKA
uniref:Alpha-glucosidase n=1 Tax=Strombidium rassoulzadegani TaxID=1082188 RepID=A0A7S3CS22_9SPIT|mmetsp:Transcript_5343/g.8994  ORF Transcript_5343/g.8994 Transcript_5343/m.8994 type:complete len:459 (+) Transcript_5343:1472-2848(+)